MSLAKAKTEVRTSLDQGGHRDWTISVDSSLPDDQCVAASIDAAGKTIVLVASLAPNVRAALDSARQYLYSACLDKTAAIAYLRGVLDGIHADNYEIRTDGPLTYPVDQRAAVQAHYDAGCWMYAVSGWSRAGHQIYYMVGR